MAYEIPAHVRAFDSRDPHVRYEWDDWSDEDEPVEDDFYERLKGISHRAIAAFAIATAEWIVYRFKGLEDDPMLEKFLASAWAQIVHFRYGLPWEEHEADEDWVGPVRGPLRMTMTWVSFAISEAEAVSNPMLRAAWLASLAQIVLPDAEPYRAWRERIMPRLESLYPSKPLDSLGDVVPREALDPDFPFRVEDTERLVNAFLSQLSPSDNPFLVAADSMLEQGFEGTPYTFSLEADREARF